MDYLIHTCFICEEPLDGYKEFAKEGQYAHCNKGVCNDCATKIRKLIGKDGNDDNRILNHLPINIWQT